MTAFLQALRDWPRLRVYLPDIRRLWLKTHPEQLQHPERDRLMLEALQALADKAVLNLPSTTRFTQGGMPEFVTLTQQQRSTEDRERRETLMWHPRLGFWTELKTDGEQEAAEKINTWLNRRHGIFERVPLRERSLEIFGDEKFLDKKVKDGKLFGGRLSLDFIGAFAVPHPLPYRTADAAGHPVLVVENLHSYWSLAEWNLRVRRFSAVAYGSGNALCSSGPALQEVLRECGASELCYLGDLDPEGLRIPFRFNAAGELKLHPAVDMYTFLLRRGVRRSPVSFSNTDTAIAQTWLPTLAEELLVLWQAAQWIPQESLGTEQLKQSAFEFV